MGRRLTCAFIFLLILAMARQGDLRILFTAVAAMAAVALWRIAGSMRVRMRSASAGRAYDLFAATRAARWRRWQRLQLRRHRLIFWATLGAAAGLLALSAVSAGLFMGWLPGAPAVMQMAALQVGGFVLLNLGATLWRGERFGAEPRCPRCDHDLTGVPGPIRCPECGTVVPPTLVRRGHLYRRRGEGVTAFLVGVTMIFGLLPLDRTPLGTALARLTPTAGLLAQYTGHTRPLMDDAYERELLDRLANHRDARTMAVQFLADGLAGKRSAPFLFDLSEWTTQAIMARSLTVEEVDLLAECALLGTERGEQAAAWFLQQLQQLAPDAVQRARERAE